MLYIKDGKDNILTLDFTEEEDSINYLSERTLDLLFEKDKGICVGYDSNKSPDLSLIRLLTGQHPTSGTGGFLVNNVTTELDEAPDQFSKIFKAFKKQDNDTTNKELQSRFQGLFDKLKEIEDYDVLQFEFFMRRHNEYKLLERLQV